MKLQSAPCRGWKGQGIQYVLHWPFPIHIISHSKCLSQPIGPLGGLTVSRLPAQDLADSLLCKPKLPSDHFGRYPGVTKLNNIVISPTVIFLHREAGKGCQAFRNTAIPHTGVHWHAPLMLRLGGEPVRGTVPVRVTDGFSLRAY